MQELKFTNELQFERNKYIFLINVVSALLDLNLTPNCRLTSLIFTKLAYNYSKIIPSEQERIKQIYQEQELSNYQLPQIEGQIKLTQIEKSTVIKYIEELRLYIEQQEKDQLKFILACHLNNVIDALKMEEFFNRYILVEESRFHKQPYFEAINGLLLYQLLNFIDQKIKGLYQYQ